ncbi:MAG: hypothetical protein E4H14_13175 [Candidatus Thorarchaeota archaeon]|nr:MAG: hypothetical protein E4H14_13175 [Candidatus Thorarchaeota archaeon]
MHAIGEAKGIKLYAPKNAYFSYFNSPYFGHSHAAAIDIYPEHQEWGGPFVSPVAGKVVRIKKTLMGRKKEFPTDEFDFGIAIQPEDNEESIVRILHCKPSLNEGDFVDFGDRIGNTIRSRYFNYWTGPHYHVEIMHQDSFSRSTQSYPLELPFSYVPHNTTELPTTVEFLIDSVSEDSITGYPRNLSHTTIDGYTGLSAISNETKVIGILDGGLSHYKHGGVIGQTSAINGSLVRIQKIPVGTVRQSLKGASFFLRDPSISSYLDGKKLRGLSCFIYPKNFVRYEVPRLLLVPQTYGEFVRFVSEGDVCELKIDSASNTIKAE